jgi:HSP20 family protein
MSNQAVTPARKASIPVHSGENPIRSLQTDVNRLFNDFFGDLAFPSWNRFAGEGFAIPFSTKAPALDVRESETAYTVLAEVPGLAAKDVQVYTSDGCITLAGEKKEETETHEKGYWRQERSYGSFKRVVPMPADADIDSVAAEMKNGLLTLTVPKKTDDSAKSRKVDIRELA